MKHGRVVAWGFLVVLSAGLCAGWAALPTLEAEPKLRVALFAALGLAGLGLTIWAPGKIHLVAAALGLRLILLPAPVSDDVHRYLWEGKLIRHGINPYAHTVDAPGLAPLRDAHWFQINHRDRPTAYPPLAELIFAGVGAVAYHPLALKICFVLADVATLLLVLALLRKRGLPFWQAGWYAFNPIALIGIAAEAHYDALFVLALTAFWWAAENRRPALAWLVLGVSVQLKIVSVILAPLHWNRWNRRSAWIFPVVLLLMCAPFLQSMPALGRAVGAYAGGGQLNDLPYFLLHRFSPALPVLAYLLLAVFVFLAWGGDWAMWNRGDSQTDDHRLEADATGERPGGRGVGFQPGVGLTRASFWLLGGLLVLSPILHFWYLLWILPLLALRPRGSWLLFCLMQAGYFLVWQTEAEQGWWGLPLPVVVVIWTPFLLWLGGAAAFMAPLRAAR